LVLATAVGLLSVVRPKPLTPIGVRATAVFAGVYQHSFASNADTSVANWSTEWEQENAP